MFGSGFCGVLRPPSMWVWWWGARNGGAPLLGNPQRELKSWKPSSSASLSAATSPAAVLVPISLLRAINELQHLQPSPSCSSVESNAHLHCWAEKTSKDGDWKEGEQCSKQGPAAPYSWPGFPAGIPPAAPS